MAVNSVACFTDLPPIVMLPLLERYFPINDLRSLRMVCWRLRDLVDSVLNFQVPLNNSTIRWMKDCVPYIDEVTVGPLSPPTEERSLHKAFLQLPDSWFPEVLSFTCSSNVDETYFPKLFEVFPNIKILALQKLNNFEIMNVLELSSHKVEASLMPRWNNLEKLKIIIPSLIPSYRDAFYFLSLRVYPWLQAIHLEYTERELQGIDGSDESFIPIYVNWMEIIAAHHKTLRRLTLKIDPGTPCSSIRVPDRETEVWQEIHKDSSRITKLTTNLEKVTLSEFTVRPHFYEINKSSYYWNWSWHLLQTQKHLVSLTLDLNDSWDASRGNETDDSILTGLLQRFQNSLKAFTFYASSIRVLTIEDIPLVNSRVVFDCKVLEGCPKLEMVTLSRGWSRRLQDWGPALGFRNVQCLPKNLNLLNLYTKCGKLNSEDAKWIASNLKKLQEVNLPLCLNREIVTCLLANPSVQKFTLGRDSDSNSILNRLKEFCSEVDGLDYFCPELKTYDPSRRWLDLLFIQVEVDRRNFTLKQEHFSKYPQLLEASFINL